MTPIFVIGLVFLVSSLEITGDNGSQVRISIYRTLAHIHLFQFFIILAYSTYSCSHIYFGMILMYMLIGVILLTVSPFSILTKSDSSTKYLKAYKNNVGI